MTGLAANSDITAFMFFIRMLDQPTPAPPTSSTARGRTIFSVVGCALCHTPSMQAAASKFIPPPSNVQVNLFSDLIVHNMRTGLADGVKQGNANTQEFGTALLWGVGQRVFFLHDGRASDLQQAIRAHASSGSEANGSIALFNRLSPSRQQDLGELPVFTVTLGGAVSSENSRRCRDILRACLPCARDPAAAWESFSGCPLSLSLPPE